MTVYARADFWKSCDYMYLNYFIIWNNWKQCIYNDWVWKPKNYLHQSRIHLHKILQNHEILIYVRKYKFEMKLFYAVDYLPSFVQFNKILKYVPRNTWKRELNNKTEWSSFILISYIKVESSEKYAKWNVRK